MSFDSSDTRLGERLARPSVCREFLLFFVDTSRPVEAESWIKAAILVVVFIVVVIFLIVFVLGRIVGT